MKGILEGMMIGLTGGCMIGSLIPVLAIALKCLKVGTVLGTVQSVILISGCILWLYLLLVSGKMVRKINI